MLRTASSTALMCVLAALLSCSKPAANAPSDGRDSAAASMKPDKSERANNPGESNGAVANRNAMPGDMSKMPESKTLEESVRAMRDAAHATPELLKSLNNSLGAGGAPVAGRPMAPSLPVVPNPGPAAQPQPQPEDPTAGEQYGKYVENEFVEAAKDAKSTFAIDVDTASYTIMRRDILAKRLPNPDSVRVEEYLNYFDYGYAPPQSAEHPFAAHLEAAPSPFSATRHILRIGLQGYEVPEAKRQPVNLVFLIDVSGSMNGPSRLPLVIYSLKQMVMKLNPADTLAICVYAGAAGTVLPPTSVTNKDAILDKLDMLHAGGSTAGGAGIALAYAVAERAKEEFAGRTTRVVLCTDGDFNIGATGDSLITMIENYREKGVFLSLLLFGTGNINDKYMEQLANKGNGNYAYINTQGEANRVVGEKLTSTLQVIAKDVKLQVEFNPAVVARHRLVGYENRKLRHEDFRNDTVDAGEMGAGHSVTALYEIELAPNAPADVALATVAMRYKAPTATAQDAATEFSAAIRRDEVKGSFAMASASFRFAVAVAQYAQLLRQSKHTGAATLEGISALAEGALDNIADRKEFMKLAALASDVIPRK